VAFRVDAGPEIGIGHLKRCATLAAALSYRGCAVRFICRDRFGPEVENLAAPHPICWLDDGKRDVSRHAATDAELQDADATLMIIGDGTTSAIWVVVDAYRLGHRWEQRVREAGHRILVIDDYRDRRHHADLLVGDSAAPFDPTSNALGGSARALTGRQYALVDPVFAFGESRPIAAMGTKRFLLTYGGADSTDETFKALAAICALKDDPNFRQSVGGIDVVVGPANLKSAIIARAAKGIPDVTLHRAVPSLEPLMRRADLVLTAGGNSMVEALTLRKPCIVTITADNQAAMVAELEAEGAIRSLGRHGTVGAGDVLKMIKQVLSDLGRLRCGSPPGRCSIISGHSASPTRCLRHPSAAADGVAVADQDHHRRQTGRSGTSPADHRRDVGEP
jgi:UDP-2,4-diacetamido-2,4,6-trideoxy-beta-L-altropyranose hydrolase